MSISGKYSFANDDGKVESFYKAMNAPADMIPLALAMSKADIEITQSGDSWTMGNEARKVTFTLGSEFTESYGEKSAKIVITKPAANILERVTVADNGMKATTKMVFGDSDLVITQTAPDGTAATRNYKRA